MADLDFGAPSFSLGLDLDLDADPPTSPLRESLPKSAGQSSIDAKFPAFEVEDADFHLQEDPDPEPLPVLKRLRRRPRTPPLSRQESGQPLNAEDDIEEFSSQEDQRKDEYLSTQNHSACSSSKFSLHSQKILYTQSASKLKTQESTSASSVSTFASVKGISNEGTLPKLTISPLRKIQLVDSDSDDPSSSEGQPEKDKKAVACAKGRQVSSICAVPGNQQTIAKTSSNKLQTESLWTDFSPKRNTKFATPALDEFCEEYFSSMKEKSEDQKKRGEFGSNSSRSLSHGRYLEELDGSFQENGIQRNTEHYVKELDPHPPAYHYFYHSDQRIQKLVRDRLPNFFPVGAVNHKGNGHSETIVLDYMSQFGHRDASTEVHVTRSRVHEGSSKTKRIKQNNGKTKSRQNNGNVMASQASEGWINTKTCAAVPRDAGKRRVSAGSHSSGHWYTTQEGRKVYVAKNGQEMTGQAAYRHYKKESGMGFRRKLKKKAAPKKKARR